MGLVVAEGTNLLDKFDAHLSKIEYPDKNQKHVPVLRLLILHASLLR